MNKQIFLNNIFRGLSFRVGDTGQNGTFGLDFCLWSEFCYDDVRYEAVLSSDGVCYHPIFVDDDVELVDDMFGEITNQEIAVWLADNEYYRPVDGITGEFVD